MTNASRKGSANELAVKKELEAIGLQTAFRKVRARSTTDYANLFDLVLYGKITGSFTYNNLPMTGKAMEAFRVAIMGGKSINLFVSSKTNQTINEEIIKKHIAAIAKYKDEYGLPNQFFCLAINYNARWIGKGKKRKLEPKHIEYWMI